MQEPLVFRTDRDHLGESLLLVRVESEEGLVHRLLSVVLIRDVGDKLTVAVLDVGQGAVAVELDLEDEVGVVEETGQLD